MIVSMIIYAGDMALFVNSASEAVTCLDSEQFQGDAELGLRVS